MGYRFLTHFFPCLIFFTLLLSHLTASPCPLETEHIASRVPFTEHPWTLPLQNPEPNLDVSAVMQSEEDATAPNTPPCEDANQGFVANMRSSPSGNDHICSFEDYLPLGFERPEMAMADESASDVSEALIRLPSEITKQHQPMQQVHHGPSEASICDDDDAVSRAFGLELRKGSKIPESGQPSRQHNNIPLTAEVLGELNPTQSDRKAEVAYCDPLFEKSAKNDASFSEAKDLGFGDKDPAISGGHGQELAARIHGAEIGVRNGNGGGSFQKTDPGHLLNVLAKSKGLESGVPSKGHNNVASE